MPSQKRPLEASTPPPSPQPPLDEEKADDSLQGGENHTHEETGNACGSDESPYSSDGETDEFIVVKVAEIRKEVQCSVCLGIIRKTRTFMECLHRFCGVCIDESMRRQGNECPGCHTHCASGRTLRDDPNYDALIATLYPDIDKYEEEELALHEEDIALNKQINASISRTLRRQEAALRKKWKPAKARVAALIRRQGNDQNWRNQRNHRVVEHQVSDVEEGIYGNREVKSKRYNKQEGVRTSQQSSDGGNCDDNSIRGAEILAWGRSGMKSNTRHAGLIWASGKVFRNDQLLNLINHVLCSRENNEELKISFTLVSLLEDKIPSLKRPHLRCSPRSSVRHLCQYLAMQTSMEASEIEILIVKYFHPVNNSSSLKNKHVVINPCHNELELLNRHQKLGEMDASFTQQNLVLAYRQKVQG